MYQAKLKINILGIHIRKYVIALSTTCAIEFFIIQLTNIEIRDNKYTYGVLNVTILIN